MAENYSDYELRQSPEDPAGPPPRRRLPKIWVAVAALVIIAGVATYLLNTGRLNTGRPAPPPAEPPAASAPTAPPAGAPLGTEPMVVDLPPLSESDELVRRFVAALSSHPRIAAWLATDDLVRNFTAVVTNIAEGETPAPHLTRLRPSARFQVIEDEGGQRIDPRSYERYTPLAAAAASVDPAGAARLYSTLKPLIEDAHRDLGYGDTPFDLTFERAIVRLLGTPIPAEPIRVVPRGIGYGFENPELEQLSAAQKQLLRFGPQNQQLVQQSLRHFAREIGIPASRLPAPRFVR